MVITHGPPHGILDDTPSKKHSGDPSLFAAVAMARPRLHCFGHVHGGWGATLVRWRDEQDPIKALAKAAKATKEGGQRQNQYPTSHSARDLIKVIESLEGVTMGMWDSHEVLEKKMVKVQTMRRDKCAFVSLGGGEGRGRGDDLRLEPRKHTVFVNAAMEPAEVDVDVDGVVEHGYGDVHGSDDKKRLQFPWVVEIELPSLRQTAFQGRYNPIRDYLVNDDEDENDEDEDEGSSN